MKVNKLVKNLFRDKEVGFIELWIPDIMGSVRITFRRMLYDDGRDYREIIGTISVLDTSVLDILVKSEVAEYKVREIQNNVLAVTIKMKTSEIGGQVYEL